MEHGRYLGLGMDVLADACSWSSEATVVWASSEYVLTPSTHPFDLPCAGTLLIHVSSSPLLDGDREGGFREEKNPRIELRKARFQIRTHGFPTFSPAGLEKK